MTRRSWKQAFQEEIPKLRAQLTRYDPRKDPNHADYDPATDRNWKDYLPRWDPTNALYDTRADPYHADYDPRCNVGANDYDKRKDPLYGIHPEDDQAVDAFLERAEEEKRLDALTLDRYDPWYAKELEEQQQDASRDDELER